MKKGAILIEALLSVVVFTMVILAVVPLLSFLLRRTERSKYEAQAAVLLQESQEIAYNLFSSRWNAYPQGDYHPARGVSSWKLITGEEKNLQTRFNRRLSIRNGCRDVAGNLIDRTGGCNGTPDPNTKVITTNISWVEGELPKTIVGTLVIVNFENL